MIKDDSNQETVYVLGAGASHGEDLSVSPPLLTEFFDGKFIAQVDKAGASSYHTTPVSNIFVELIGYLAVRYHLDEDFGEKRWRELNLEQVFTDLAIEREFFGHDSRQGTESQKLMMQLKQYIRHILCVTCK